jgi:hypothetical protein
VILTNCAQAAAPHGAVLVIEAVRGHDAHTTIDLFMMICFGGRERTTEELAQLATDCGLALRAFERVADYRTLLEFDVVDLSRTTTRETHARIQPAR